MKYRSTRGGISNIPFKQAVMMGLADDGGLLVPHLIPDISAQLSQFRGLGYTEIALKIISLYVDDIDTNDLKEIINKSYATFSVPEVTPLVALGDDYLLELFHGPTLAFKDIALQFLGNLFDHILEESGEHLNILGATSGDTGSAAIAGVRGRDNVDIFVMFPDGKTSPVQEMQMTTILDANVHNLAVSGSFDDCQHILKTIFSDLDFKKQYRLGAVNSVNWARVLAQVVYYFSAWTQLDCPERFQVSVPTGNFGNIFAAYLARKMGLPITRLILATNSNDILARFFATGVYERGEVNFSVSPAMDIQVASNFERYLFYAFGGNSDRVKTFMSDFSATGCARANFNTPVFDSAFVAASVTDEETIEMICSQFKDNEYILDPHTAVGVHVGRQQRLPGIPLVCLSTAHPAKFPDVVRRALPGVEVSHPSIEALHDLATRRTDISVDADAVKKLISSRVAGAG